MAQIVRALFVGVALCFVTVVAPAAAQDEEARIHFSSGASYYARGDYQRALDEFTAAQQMSGRAELFYNIALCHQQLGNLPEAAAALERYLRDANNVQDRPTLEARLENIRIRIREREEAAARDASLAAQNDTTPREPEQADEPEPSHRSPPPSWAYIGFGAAGLGAVGWGTFGGLALSNRNSIADGCGAMRACTKSDVATMDRLALLSDISMGVTIAGAVVGVVGLVLPRHDPEDTAAPTAMVLPLVDARTGTVGVSVGGRF